MRVNTNERLANILKDRDIRINKEKEMYIPCCNVWM